MLQYSHLNSVKGAGNHFKKAANSKSLMRRAKILILTLLNVVILFSGCSEKKDLLPAIEIQDKETQNQQFSADDTSGKNVVFTTSGAWSSSIKEQVTVQSPTQRTASWISIN